MLAPLKDRSIIERECGESSSPDDSTRAAQLLADNLALRAALRQARQRQRRSATEATRQIVALTNELNRLQQQYAAVQQQLDTYTSGQAIAALGQRLVALSEENEQLSTAARRVWYLDKTLCAAHHECARLAEERDAAIARCKADF